MSFESVLSIELKNERRRCQELMRINFDLTSKLKAAESKNAELENQLQELKNDGSHEQ